jgi:hypothetical protein
VLILRTGASIAQPYDASPGILRHQIKMMGAGLVGNVKSALADTVTVTSDGSYSVIPKGEKIAHSRSLMTRQCPR